MESWTCNHCFEKISWKKDICPHCYIDRFDVCHCPSFKSPHILMLHDKGLAGDMELNSHKPCTYEKCNGEHSKENCPLLLRERLEKMLDETLELIYENQLIPHKYIPNNMNTKNKLSKRNSFAGFSTKPNGDEYSDHFCKYLNIYSRFKKYDNQLHLIKEELSELISQIIQSKGSTNHEINYYRICRFCRNGIHPMEQCTSFHPHSY